MPRKFVSPGVFLEEIDQSFLAQGVASIGAAIIGRTAKGPAFAPTVVTDFNDFVARFGDVDPTMQAPYAAKNYLKNSSTLTVVRVLGSRDGKAGITNGDLTTTRAIVDASGAVLSVIAIMSGITATLSATTTASSDIAFSFTGGAVAFSGTASLVTTSPNYIGKVLNFNPLKATTYGHYVWKNFDFAGLASGAPFSSASLSGVAATGAFDHDYTLGQSPWVRSQAFGAQRYNLFRFWTLAAGDAANTDVKVTIANIQPSQFPALTDFGTFDVIVRVFTDSDLQPSVVDTFSGLTLDPTSPNYLPRIIGDETVTWNSTTRKNIVSGTYRNGNKYVRVEMGTDDVPDSALPWGHTGYPLLTTDGVDVVTIPFVSSNLDNQGNLASYLYWGIDNTKAGIEDVLSYNLALTSSALASTVAGTALDLSEISGTTVSGTTYAIVSASYTATNPSGAIDATADAVQAYAAATHGFTMDFYGGFDGFDPTVTSPELVAATNSVATIANKLAIDAISNPDEIDLNLLALPGVVYPTVTDYARQMCNNRADVMYIMDISGSSVSSAISALNSRAVDDNYTACYYPDLRYSDNTTNVIVSVKPSVAVLGAFAFSDRIGQVFFAPAGLNRGGLAAFNIVDTVDRLNFQDRDDLYTARINPIATFPNEGIVVFGQKTLQARPSALDRVNVRRLLIFAKKTIASVAKLLVFEPDNAATWQRFTNTVNPILETIRQNQGIERFKVVMDATNNTPADIDRNIMRGKILLVPTRAAEFVDLSFVISASGVSFEE